MSWYRWIVEKTLDAFLYVLILIGAVFSLKGFYRTLILAFLVAGFGLGVNSVWKASAITTDSLSVKESVDVVEALPITPHPKENAPQFPLISSKSILVVDVNSGQILHQENPDLSLAPASTTKIMTALVALDLYELDEIVPVSEQCVGVTGNSLGLSFGEQLLFSDLIHALIIASSNDAACVLANARISEEYFVLKMNQKAQEIGMEKTTFTNSVGFDGYNGDHVSTARDLFKLALAARSNDYLKSVYSKPVHTLESGALPREIKTTNYLLGNYPGTVGIKTGTTTQAGQVLIYEYSDEVKDLIIVLMGSSARFDEVSLIMGWVGESFEWF